MPFFDKDPKRDYNFDNHPGEGLGVGGVGFSNGFLGLVLHRDS